MAHIRKIAQNHLDGKWAYIEFSDEDKSHLILLGEKEFDTEEEALEYKKGFTLESYVWVDPKN